jgi:hypothetical protein
LFVSDDDGDTWEQVPDVSPKKVPRKVIWNGQMVFFAGADKLYSLDTNGDITVYDPPDYLINYAWNMLAVSGSYLYILCSDRLYRSDNLETWEFYCDFGRTCVGLSVWDGVGLIVSEQGSDARLLKVPIT